ncbi:MAG TPA: hypothetical protein VHB02_14115 [Acidimicrobiales bacterium]|nr:hypothetical protein [Acidimicrobiales bacterium]
MKAALPVVGVVAVLVGGMPALAAGASTAQSWSTLRQSAMTAVGAYRGNGALAITEAPSPVSTSTVTTADGVISVAQQSFVATDAAGTVDVNVTLLGGRQLVVHEVDPTADYRGEALVLRPGTASVSGSYALPGTGRAATTQATTAGLVRTTGGHRHGGVPASGAVSHGHGMNARLVTIGGCGANPSAPVVIGSTFGPLIDGEGVISCFLNESLAEIVSDYEGSTHVGNTNSGTGSGTWLGVNSYAACTIIGGTNSFHTAELWSVNGIFQGGATSSSSALHCA